MRFPDFQIPISPQRRVNIRKSEIRLDSAFSRFAAITRRDGGIVEVSSITVVLGGSEMVFSMNSSAAWRSLWREIEERTVAESRLL